MAELKAGNDEDGGEGLISGGKIMPLMEHLGELRTRLLRALTAIFVLFLAGMGFAEYLFEFIKAPLCAANIDRKCTLVFLGPMDVFLVNIKIAFIASFVIGCPIWLYELWKFIEPALYPRERRYAMPFLFASVSLFFTGISFCYYVLLPMMLEFLVKMGESYGIQDMLAINEYVSMVTVLTLGFGLVFQTPIVLILLAMLGLFTADELSSYRRFVIVAIMIIAAVLTPPDPFSQIAMAVPLYIMYEASIVIIRLMKIRQDTQGNDAAA